MILPLHKAKMHMWCKKVKESEVTQSCPTLCDPVDSSLPGSSVHGILQARILEWVAISLLLKKREKKLLCKDLLCNFCMPVGGDKLWAFILCHLTCHAL